MDIVKLKMQDKIQRKWKTHDQSIQQSGWRETTFQRIYI